MEQIFINVKIKKKNNNSKKRPHTHKRISNIKILSDALQWRQRLIQDILGSYNKMFDPLLSQDKLQEYNDQLNILIKQLRMWDWHGKNTIHGPILHGNISLYTQLKSKRLILGIQYYGRTIELPDIKNHLDEHPKKRISLEKMDCC